MSNMYISNMYQQVSNIYININQKKICNKMMVLNDKKLILGNNLTRNISNFIKNIRSFYWRLQVVIILI